MMLLGFTLYKFLIKCRCRALDKGYECVGGVLNERCDLRALLCTEFGSSAMPNWDQFISKHFRPYWGYIFTICQDFVCLDWIAALLVRLDVKFGEGAPFISHWLKLMLHGTSNFPLKSILSLGTKQQWFKRFRSPREPLFPFPYWISHSYTHPALLHCLNPSQSVCVALPLDGEVFLFLYRDTQKVTCLRSPRKAVIDQGLE